MFQYQKEFFPLTKYHLKIIFGSLSKFPWLFQDFPYLNFIPRLFQAFQSLDNHAYTRSVQKLASATATTNWSFLV